MKFLKLYEKFNKMDFDKFFNYIQNNYKEIISKKFGFTGKEQEKYTPFNVSDTWVSYDGNTFAVSEKDGKYYLQDFNEPLGDTHDIELPKEQYDKYLNIIKAVEEESNKMEEEKISSERPRIDSSGNVINLKKNNLDEYLSDYLGKEYSYEVEVVKWTSNSKNTRSYETLTFTNTGFNADKRDDGIYIEVFADCSLDNEEYSFLVDSNSIDEYVDIENQKDRLSSLENSLHMYKTEKQTNRQMKNNNYPSYMFFDAVPNEYDTIEFIKHLKNVIYEINTSSK